MPNIRESYEAVVSSDQDPEKRGRIKVTCRALVAEGVELHEWLEPVFPYTSKDGFGWFFVPKPGTPVEIEAVVAAGTDDSPHQAFISNPEFKWRGCLYASASDVPAELAANYGKRMGIKAPGGQLVCFDEEQGLIVLQAAKRINLGGFHSTEPLVLGNVLIGAFVTLIQLLLVHTHTAAGGPTGILIQADGFLALQNSPFVDRLVVSDIAFTQKA